MVEDEKSHALSSGTLGADGSVHTRALTARLFQMFSEIWKLDDLEGLTLDGAGFAYALASHSRDDGSDEKKSREKLVRFRIEGDRGVDLKVFEGLKSALTATHPVHSEAQIAGLPWLLRCFVASSSAVWRRFVAQRRCSDCR